MLGNGIKISAASTGVRYRGEAARMYEAARVTRPQWDAEQQAVSSLMEGMSGTVLDCPVGTGRFLPLYHRLGLRCIGVDISEDMLDEARVKDGAADLRLGDIFRLGLPAVSVDISVCVRLLNLITEAEMVAAIAALCRVSRSAIILSIRLGDVAAQRGRSLTHRQSIFDEVLQVNRWVMIERRELRSDGYAMVRLAPCA